MTDCPKIVAFDLGMEMGYAAGDATGAVVELGVEKFVSKSHPGQRYSGALSFFSGILTRHQPDIVAYEAVYRHKGIDAAHSYGALHGLLMVACFELGARLHAESGTPAPKRGVAKFTKPEIRIISPTALKKYATGKGNADKEAMADAAIRRWPEFRSQLDLGAGVINDDLADALWIHEATRLGIATEK